MSSQLINASIITIGDELLIGQTIDTNSAWMAQELNKAGIWVKRRVAIGDDADDIKQALKDESQVADIILITGGLGPTADDITKSTLCEYFEGKLVVNEEVLEHVKYLFEKIYRRPGPILETNLKQAEVPDVCTVILNERGTAPGMWFEKDGKVFVSMPGVPHEMKEMMERVIGLLKEKFQPGVIIHRTALTAGQGESFIANMLTTFEESLPPGIKLAYLPAYGMVRLRLTTTGISQVELEELIDTKFSELKKIIVDYLVTDEDSPLELALGNLLRSRKKSVATAESCTGGYIAHLLTRHSGSSDYFLGSVVGYSNDLKEKILHVESSTLSERGAVSEETVRQMIKGVFDQTKADYAIATSGIMGPGGGTAEKPVGTVWIAVGNRQETETKLLHLRFDRMRNIETTAYAAMNLLRIFVTNDI